MAGRTRLQNVRGCRTYEAAEPRPSHSAKGQSWPRHNSRQHVDAGASQRPSLTTSAPTSKTHGAPSARPLGGSIGFEAGLTGIITAGCCWIRDRLKVAGLRAASIADVTIAASLSAIFATPLAGLVGGFESESDEALQTELGNVDDYNLRREAKLVLYLAAAIGSFGGIVVFGRIFGGSGGFPRFEAIGAHGLGLLWGLLALVAAYVLLLVFRGTEKGAKVVSHYLESRPHGVVARPVIAGVLLGSIALALPLVLFPGEEQSHELMETWGVMPAAVLLATGVLKAFVTPLCIELGWKGGDLFPCIFAGVATGYGLAALTGADAMLMVTVTTTAFLAGVTKKPLLALGILALASPCAASCTWASRHLPVPPSPFRRPSSSVRAQTNSRVPRSC